MKDKLVYNCSKCDSSQGKPLTSWLTGALQKSKKFDDTDGCEYLLLREVFEEKKLGETWKAEIHMERVRQWLQLDELFEKERQI
ncbi:hypothetical protein OUZ56_024891 [Daphnia magna]|uniref:Uncharacterized protein n=1 Tax=Daphnia magna TaxID=35525 RepID=A0ABQ9ZJQ6_9CRUS|nr:hypothetical protein OUZ56_024891 [Daphnia magna]